MRPPFFSRPQRCRSGWSREMRDRMEEEEAEVPVDDGPFAYYARYREGGQHELVCRRPRSGGPEQIMLDGDALAEGLDFFELGDAVPSSDHSLLAWSLDDKGSELHTIKVRDLGTARIDPTLSRGPRERRSGRPTIRPSST